MTDLPQGLFHTLFVDRSVDALSGRSTPVAVSSLRRYRWSVSLARYLVGVVPKGLRKAAMNALGSR